MKEAQEFFDLNRFNKAPALYDLKKLDWINGQQMRTMNIEALNDFIKKDSNLNFFNNEDQQWKNEFLSLHLEKVQTIDELKEFSSV